MLRLPLVLRFSARRHGAARAAGSVRALAISTHLTPTVLRQAANRAVVASLAAAAIVAVASPPSFAAAEEPFIEKDSGIAFSKSLDGTKELLGAGVRTKFFIKLQIYAVGIYMDVRRGDLKGWEGKSAEALAQDDAFFSALIASPGDKVVVIKMARNVGAQTMVDALEEALKPRMDALSKGDGGRAATGCAAVKAFKETLVAAAGKDMDKGTDITLTIRGGGTSVEMQLNGKVLGSVASADLAAALLDTYLGKEAVSPSARRSVAGGVAARLG